MTTSFTRSPAGNQLWNSGRQNWILGRIGDQEGAISDPVKMYVICRGYYYKVLWEYKISIEWSFLNTRGKNS